MNAPINHSNLAQREHEPAIVTMGFGSLQSFEFMQRTAKMFSSSSMVPAAYQAMATKGYGDRQTVEPNPSALANCVIALDMSQRMNANPLMIMQNLHIIEGRPSWSSQFIIAAINNCGKFSPLRFDLQWMDEIDASYSTFDWVDRKKVEKKHSIRIKNARCVAWAIEKATGERLESAPVTMEMAVAEGWFGKNGSKWKSMPDLMMRYRSAAFFGRIYAPELLMGLPAADEVHDIVDVKPQADGSYAADPVQTEGRAARSERGAGAEDATVKNEPFPQDQFDKNLPGWLKLIADGKKTAEQIIATVQSRHPLTDEQKAAIQKSAVPASPTGLTDRQGEIHPAKSFDDVMVMLCAATSEDALYVAAEWIEPIADADGKAILNGKFDERLAQLKFGA